MGITIHYQGRLENRVVLSELLDAARLFCNEQGWPYSDVDERIIGTVERLRRTRSEENEGGWTDEWVETETAPIDDTLRGIVIQPHPECESLTLTFNAQGELCSFLPLNEPGTYWENKMLFTKTQFAPIEVHVGICEFLHFIQDRYFPGLQVSDEGEYFETGDVARLEARLDYLSAALDRLQSRLENLDDDDPAADLIRRTMDSMESDADAPRPRKKRKLKVERGKKLTVRSPQWKRGHGSSAGKN